MMPSVVSVSYHGSYMFTLDIYSMVALKLKRGSVLMYGLELFPAEGKCVLIFKL